MKTCREITELAAEYIDKQLPWRQRFAFRMHLMMCRHCQRFVKQYRSLTASLPKVIKDKPVDKKTVDDIYKHL